MLQRQNSEVPIIVVYSIAHEHENFVTVIQHQLNQLNVPRVRNVEPTECNGGLVADVFFLHALTIAFPGRKVKGANRPPRYGLPPTVKKVNVSSIVLRSVTHNVATFVLINHPESG
jgi:hypothetical protein